MRSASSKPNAPKPRAKILKDSAGYFRFSIVAANGETVCQSEGYTSRYHAQRGVEALIAAVKGLPKKGK